ncbi:MAG: ABC transporter substrate-binding protein [Clostridia bacterium]
MKKIIALILISALLLFGLLACVDNDKDDGLIRLNEVTHSVFYAPLYVAINNGYFTEEGLTIELTNGGGSDKTMTAIMSGQADIGLLGPETAVYVKLGGSSNYPVVFGQLTKKDGSFLIGRTPEPDFKWEDLKGKEIIGGRHGGMPAMSLEYAIKKNNLENDLTINYDVQFDLIAAAFEGGTGDYCTLFEPLASAYQDAGKGYIIASVGAEAGEMPYTCFMATKDYINKNNEKVVKFMRAIIKAVDFVTNNDDGAVADALLPSFPATSKATLQSAVAAYKAIDGYKTTPVMSEDEFDNLLDVLLTAGVITETVPYTSIIDNSIAEKLLNE